MQAQTDLAESPGIGVCDRCERIIEVRWFACFQFCEQCAWIATEAIGLDAVGRAIERLSDLLKQERKRGETKGTRSAA